MTPSPFPFSLAFGAPTLTDSIDLGVAALGGQGNVRETSFFVLCTSRAGFLEFSDIMEELFHPGVGTVLQIASKLDHELVVINPPGDSLSCWCGLVDLRESPADLHVTRMLRSGKALFVTIGIEESPLPTDCALANAHPLEGSEDYVLVSCL